MRIAKVAGHNVAIVTTEEITKDYLQGQCIVQKSDKWLSCAETTDDRAKRLAEIVKQPEVRPIIDIAKMMELLEVDGFHSGCCDAIGKGAIMKVECKDLNVTKWLESYQSQDSFQKLLQISIEEREACGNGFIMLQRNRKGEWVGLERMLPQEMGITLHTDENNFLRPNFIQRKSGKILPILNEDMFHLKKYTHRSQIWGASSIPPAQGIETLKQIKALDFNNFKNGLLIDYFIIVNGGTIKDSEEYDENGEKVNSLSDLEDALRAATGTKRGHSTVLLESEDPNSKIELIPLRQEAKDGAFIKLKEEIRNEILAYHRVPKRIIAQATSGQLSGDNNSDMIMFYNLVLKPIQQEVAEMLSRKFREEFGWTVTAKDWDFGKLTDIFKTPEELALEVS